MQLTQQATHKLQEDLVLWIRQQMKENGGHCAVLGISGGKDSSVAAALCVKALGKENVYGVLMPDGQQHDIDFSKMLCTHLGICNTIVNIENIRKSYQKTLESETNSLYSELSKQAKVNLPPRIRMSVLYAVAQSLEGARVINTGNLSEKWIGYSTIYGDTAGAFAPLSGLTSDEVVQLGKALRLPDPLIYKVPEDGLTGRPDEDSFGFSYQILNRYIRFGEIADKDAKEKIDRLHRMNRFKTLSQPFFEPGLPVFQALSPCEE